MIRNASEYCANLHEAVEMACAYFERTLDEGDLEAEAYAETKNSLLKNLSGASSELNKLYDIRHKPL